MPKYMIEFNHAIETCDMCPVCLLNKETGLYHCILSPCEEAPGFRNIPVYYSDIGIRKPEWCPLLDGVSYLKARELELSMPTLFDLEGLEAS